MIEFKVDSQRCTACEECVRECPRSIIEMHEGLPRILADKEEACIRCQHCLAVCKPAAVSILGVDPDSCTALKGNMPTEAQMATLIAGRRSTRRFKDVAVPPGEIGSLLETVANAPTGVNTMQTLFTVVDDPGVMAKIREESYRSLRRAADAGQLPEPLQYFETFLEPWEEHGVDILYRGAPHMLIASTPESGPSPAPDCNLALAYFELLANSAGLGTVWCGLGKWMVDLIDPSIKKRLGVPDDHLLGYMMMFGRPAVRFHRTVQRGPARVNRVRWE